MNRKPRSALATTLLATLTAASLLVIAGNAQAETVPGSNPVQLLRCKSLFYLGMELDMDIDLAQAQGQDALANELQEELERAERGYERGDCEAVTGFVWPWS